jgi:hypothetical protein
MLDGDLELLLLGKFGSCCYGKKKGYKALENNLREGVTYDRVKKYWAAVVQEQKLVDKLVAE